MAEITKVRSEIESLVDRDEEPLRIATGFTFTEGPVWDRRGKRLFFSDIPGNTVYQWTEDNGHSIFRKPSGNTNGNTLDDRSRLISCEHSGRRVARTEVDGSVVTLVDRYQNKRLNSPNDVICASDGSIIFTDPPYGLYREDGTIAPGELDFNGVYRFDTSGDLHLLVDDFTRPNGLLLDAREEHLFIDDTERRHVRVFDVAPDGSLQNGKVFAELIHGDVYGRPDGMKTDSEGNIYVAGNTIEGVWVFDPDGVLLGMIGVDEGPANLAWGGDDWRTLFITANTSVYRLAMRVKGSPVGML